MPIHLLFPVRDEKGRRSTSWQENLNYLKIRRKKKILYKGHWEEALDADGRSIRRKPFKRVE